MTDVIEARAPAGTHTVERRWAETETPKPPQDRGQDYLPPPVDLVQFESRSNIDSIVLGRKDTFTVPASDDRKKAILQAPGTHLSSRLRQVLPFIASCGLLADTPLADVIKRLLSDDAQIAAQRVRHPELIPVEFAANKWMAQVRAWASSHPQSDRVIDDSRESIYGDRG